MNNALRGQIRKRRALRRAHEAGVTVMWRCTMPSAVFGVPPSRARALAEFKFSTVTAAAALARGHGTVTRAAIGRAAAARPGGTGSESERPDSEDRVN